MNNEVIFRYNYSAKENKEIQEIRNRYLPPTESKLETLKHLDYKAQTAGQIESLTLGIGGSLVFGLGLCFAMKVIGESIWLGLIFGSIGIAAMSLAYPMFLRISRRVRKELTPRILELAEELATQFQ